MFKPKEELIKMTVPQIAKYVRDLEENNEDARNNSFEYQDWCANDLDEVLFAKGVSPQEFARLMQEA